MTEEIIEKTPIDMIVEAITSIPYYIIVFVLLVILSIVVFALTNRIDQSTFVILILGSALISILFKEINKGEKK